MSTINVTLPHKFVPRWYQKEVYKAFNGDPENNVPPCKRIIVMASRRLGKDLLCWNLAIQRCIEKPIIAWYIAPTQAQARKIIWENKTHEGTPFMDCIPKELIKKIDETSKIVHFINGSTLWLCSADSDSLVGSNPSLIVFSEYALMQKDPLPLLLPIVQANGGTLIFNTTPRGINHFYKLYNKALNNPEWKVFKHIITDVGVYSPEQIEVIRSETTQSMFEQEYLCQFNASSANVFRNIENCIQKEPPERDKLTYQILPYERYYMGVDLAKSIDNTVITAVNLHTSPFKVYPQTVISKLDYSFQKVSIKSEFNKFNQPNTRLDQTGVGSPIVEDLKREISESKVEGFIFTQRSKEDLINNLAVLFENEAIVIPDDPELIAELRGFQWVEDTIRNKTVMKSIVEHDDRVMSLALACFSLPATKKKYINPQIQKDLSQYDFYKEKAKKRTINKYR